MRRVDPEYSVTVDAGSRVTFTAEASDPGSDLRYSTFSVDGQEYLTGLSYDGDTDSALISIPYTFDAPGTYSFEIHIYDSHDFSDSTSWRITVRSGNQSPVADPGGPYAEPVGQTVFFDGSGSSDVDGTIVSYAWLLGDGQTASGGVVTHVYPIQSDSRTYTVALTVVDNDGASGTAAKDVTIAGTP